MDLGRPPHRRDLVSMCSIRFRPCLLARRPVVACASTTNLNLLSECSGTWWHPRWLGFLGRNRHGSWKNSSLLPPRGFCCPDPVPAIFDQSVSSPAGFVEFLPFACRNHVGTLDQGRDWLRGLSLRADFRFRSRGSGFGSFVTAAYTATII